MSDTQAAPPANPSPGQKPPAIQNVVVRSADWGGKALIVCFLAVLMAIPGLFVFALVNDRSNRAEGVVQEVANLQGGSQQLLGPMLAVPYTQPADGDTNARSGWYLISPETGTANVTVTTTVRHRGLFEVPVYRATARMQARFAPMPQQLNLPADAVADWAGAQIVMGFSDLRGAQADVVGRLSGAATPATLAFTPASMGLGDPRSGDSSIPSRAETRGGFGLVSAPAAGLVQGRQGGVIDAELSFSGAQRLSVLPFAKSTRVHIGGDWNSPSFDGGFLPGPRTLTNQGFTADWSVPFIARGLADHARSDDLSLTAMGQRDLGVSFVRANDAYQSVTRALKYAVMFVGLVFLTFFVFEALSGKRIHPAQYVLIGLAQMIFYLLLLSLAEWVGFDGAFAGSAVATVLLIGLYAGWAFRSRKYQVQALVIFSAVYGLIYLLMRLEDFALLAGSLASFLGLSAAMWLTRNLDWYSGRLSDAAAPAPAATAPAPPAATPT